MARKPRDYDAELRELMQRTKKVKSAKTVQLGEIAQLVGADALPLEAFRRADGRAGAKQEAARGHREVDRTRCDPVSSRRQAGEDTDSQRHCSGRLRQQQPSLGGWE